MMGRGKNLEEKYFGIDIDREFSEEDIKFEEKDYLDKYEFYIRNSCAEIKSDSKDYNLGVLYGYYLERVKEDVENKSDSDCPQFCDGDKDAYNYLCNKFNGFIVKLAKHYKNETHSYNDVIQHLQTELFVIAKKRDENGFFIDKSGKLMDKLENYVNGTLKCKALDLNTLKKGDPAKVRRIKELKKEIYENEGREASNKEIADKLHMEIEEVNCLLNAISSAISFESGIDEDNGSTLRNTYADKKDCYEESISKLEIHRVRAILEELKERGMDSREYNEIASIIPFLEAINEMYEKKIYTPLQYESMKQMLIDAVNHNNKPDNKTVMEIFSLRSSGNVSDARGVAIEKFKKYATYKRDEEGNLIITIKQK